MSVPGKITGGFFPASGTNYSQGQEPQIAARLDTLGKALGLHLTGLSGYRSPQHSIAVGGFADDPHTRGQASDTPGIEGVSEATLERYGLTRPFGGAAEADHIQLSGAPATAGAVPAGGKLVTTLQGKPVTFSNGRFYYDGHSYHDYIDIPAVTASPSVAQTVGEKTASAIVNLLWGAIGKDAVRALLYIVFVLGGLALTYEGVKRLTGQGAPA